MFLWGVRRPKFDQRGSVLFHRKVGFRARTDETLARRSSWYLTTGTLEIKRVNVSRDVFKDMLVENLFLAKMLKLDPGLIKLSMRLALRMALSGKIGPDELQGKL